MAAIRLHAKGAEEDDIQEICRIAGMSRATFYRGLRQYEEEGTVHISKLKKRGRPREYVRADITYLKSLVMRTPMYYLRDLQKKLSQNRFLDLSESTFHRIFERERFSHKKAEKRAAERDEEVARFIYSTA